MRNWAIICILTIQSSKSLDDSPMNFKSMGYKIFSMGPEEHINQIILHWLESIWHNHLAPSFQEGSKLLWYVASKVVQKDTIINWLKSFWEIKQINGVTLPHTNSQWSSSTRSTKIVWVPKPGMRHHWKGSRYLNQRSLAHQYCICGSTSPWLANLRLISSFLV